MQDIKKIKEQTKNAIVELIEEASLKENDIEIEIVNIENDRDAMRDLIENGGKRQVPCLFHDGEYLYESDDIIEFLKENK